MATNYGAPEWEDIRKKLKEYGLEGVEESMQTFKDLAERTRGYLSGESQTAGMRSGIKGRIGEAMAQTGADPRSLATQAYKGQMQRGGEMQLQQSLQESLAQRTDQAAALSMKEATLPTAIEEAIKVAEESRYPALKEKPWEDQKHVWQPRVQGEQKWDAWRRKQKEENWKFNYDTGKWDYKG